MRHFKFTYLIDNRLHCMSIRAKNFGSACAIVERLNYDAAVSLVLQPKPMAIAHSVKSGEINVADA